MDITYSDPEVEGGSEAIAQAVQTEMERRLGLRVPVHLAPPGSLPRWELKARRVVDRRSGDQ